MAQMDEALEYLCKECLLTMASTESCGDALFILAALAVYYNIYT